MNREDHHDHGAEDVVDHGRLRACNGCGADSLACARKSAFGGRACCDACTHVTTRKVDR